MLALSSPSNQNQLYLEIPIVQIQLLCLKPLKYPQSSLPGASLVGKVPWLLIALITPPLQDLSGALLDPSLYYYIPAPISEAEGDLDGLVDLEVIKIKSAVPSEITTSRNDFRENILERDPLCVFSGAPEDFLSSSPHIIPYARGSEWFQTIIQIVDLMKRMSTTFTDINDTAWAVILKTQTHCLDVGDVPPPSSPTHCRPRSISFIPKDHRLFPPVVTRSRSLHVVKASQTTSMLHSTRHSQQPKPSPLLLHYNYGASALRQWGLRLEPLNNTNTIPAPKAPQPSTNGPPKSNHNRTVAIHKRNAANNPR
ncbi:hypothetical protein BS47DRAFT_1400322 [Hydnum rufescens UP504]|uniref:Uncharacterized protein n=1 Tax=Hydnum rufescens UP504 TaxID=1448309 RepID=A0A9P6AHB6_9AGAM|nr:hypothetical protein BS47DRAFT_1400322 [Hydnum rufescens UP504]